jgi:anti-sigma regulatory factor (Ser/Thr protein kinase)
MGPPAQHLELEVVPMPERIGPARAAVYQFLSGHGVPEPVAADMRLVTSELLTNALMYGHEPIALAVDLDALAVLLSVENAGPVSAIPPVSGWRMAETAAASGRGLGLVASLCDGVELAGDDHVARVVCRRSLAPGTGHG